MAASICRGPAPYCQRQDRGCARSSTRLACAGLAVALLAALSSASQAFLTAGGLSEQRRASGGALAGEAAPRVPVRRSAESLVTRGQKTRNTRRDKKMKIYARIAKQGLTLGPRIAKKQKLMIEKFVQDEERTAEALPFLMNDRNVLGGEYVMSPAKTLNVLTKIYGTEPSVKAALEDGVPSEQEYRAQMRDMEDLRRKPNSDFGKKARLPVPMVPRSMRNGGIADLSIFQDEELMAQTDMVSGGSADDDHMDVYLSGASMGVEFQYTGVEQGNR